MGPGGGGGGGGGLTSAQQDAIGYVGGGILAICLIPQVAKVVVTRSARDISISWSVLYSIGLTLSLAYLILKDAPAAWIPIIFEIAGCLLVLFLKLFYEHTAFGRNYSAAKQQQQLVLPLHDIPDSQAAADRHGFGHSLSGLVTAASGDISWRGRAVLGQHQEAPSPLTVPMIDVSVHGGSRHGGSRHGSMRGSRQNSLSLSPRAMQAGKQQPHQEQQELAGKASQAGDRQDGVLEVKCMGTSVGSCSSSSIFAVQEGPRAVAQPADAPHQQPQPQQQQPPPREPLFASTWGLQAVPPEVAGSPPAAAASRQHHHQQ